MRIRHHLQQLIITATTARVRLLVAVCCSQIRCSMKALNLRRRSQVQHKVCIDPIQSSTIRLHHHSSLNRPSQQICSQRFVDVLLSPIFLLRPHHHQHLHLIPRSLLASSRKVSRSQIQLERPVTPHLQLAILTVSNLFNDSSLPLQPCFISSKAVHPYHRLLHLSVLVATVEIHHPHAGVPHRMRATLSHRCLRVDPTPSLLLRMLLLMAEVLVSHLLASVVHRPSQPRTCFRVA